MELTEAQLISVLKVDTLLLKTKAEKLLLKIFRKKINIQIAATYCDFANTFRLCSLNFYTVRYVERFFTSIVGTQNFLDLSYNLLAKILSSSQLEIASEIEVFKAGEAWISNNTQKIRDYAKDLLLKVRIPLLSNHALEFLNNLVLKSSFGKNQQCLELMEKIMKQNDDFCVNKSPLYFANRYCNQDKFNVLVCGVNDKKSKQINGSITEENETNFKHLALLTEGLCYLEGIYFNTDVYFFGDFVANSDCCSTVGKYSTLTEAFETVFKLPDTRTKFSVCSLEDKVYVIGGAFMGSFTTNICLQFGTKYNRWTYIANLKNERENSASVVFDGRLIVSGGSIRNCLLNTVEHLKTVEMYDHVANVWSYFPSMNEERRKHKSVAVKNKLYMIGGSFLPCEVFDVKSNKFVRIIPLPSDHWYTMILPNGIMAVGEKIFVFGRDNHVWCFDVAKCNWSEITCDAVKNRAGYCSVNVPKLNL